MREYAKTPFSGFIGIAGAIALMLTLALAFLASSSSPASAAVGHSVLRTFSTGANSVPRALTVDSADNLYVVDYGSRRIEKFDSAGNPMPFTGTARYIEGNSLVGISGVGISQAPFPDLGSWFTVGLAVDTSGGPNDGDIFFTIEGEGESRTFVYAPTGVFLGRLGQTSGYHCGGAVSPSDGSVYIGQQYSGGVQRYVSPDAENLAEAAPNGEIEVGFSCAIAVDGSGDLYFAGGSFFMGDSNFETGIVKYPASQFGATKPKPSLFFEKETGANALALDPTNGDLYADKGNEVVSFSSAGVKQSTHIGQLNNSNGIVVDGSRNISATDSEGGVFVFGPNEVQLPKGTTGGASNLAPTAADVVGTVDPDGAGSITGCEFRYGEDTGYSDGSVPCTPAAPIAAPNPVSAHLSGLISGTTYHYRLFLTNANGTQMETGDQTLTTPPATAEVQTLPATEVKKDSAVLNGSYTGDGSDVHYFFEWGKTNGYGHTTPGPPGGDAGTGGGTQSVAPIQISGLDSTTLYHYRLVVSTVAGITRGPDQTLTTAIPIQKLEAAKPTVVTQTSAELRASYEGDGATETHYYFEWGQTTGYGNVTPAPPGNAIPPESGPVEVTPVTISGLDGEGATYHFRVVASNTAGSIASADQTFRTADVPVISNLQTSDVTATSAELSADLNPRHGETTYQFEWGLSSAYGNSVPVPAGDAGSGDVPVSVSAQLEGLSPGRTYHFRLVATNSYGSDVSPDQTFGFYPPECPNSQTRQETRSNGLPDCRAYELVTPSFAQGTIVLPSSGPTSGVASNPPRLAYGGTYGLFPESAGEATASFNDLYVSTRTNSGWVQRYVGQRADEAVVSAGPPGAAEVPLTNTIYEKLQRGTSATPSLDRVIDYNWGFPGQASSPKKGSNAAYVWNAVSGDSLGRWPTNLAQVQGGESYVGMPQASGDLSHFVFSSNLVFAPGGVERAAEITCCISPSTEIVWPKDYVYDNDTDTGEVVLASRKSAAKGEEPFQGRAFDISEDGSRILLTADAELGSDNGFTVIQAPIDPGQVARVSEITGPLYLRVNGEKTYEFAAGHKLRYAGSSPDGKTVYITSTEQLTPDDQDSSNDLFAWHESEPDSLTRLSFGDHGDAGNTENGIVLPGINQGSSNDGSIGNGWSDDDFASESGDFYFESPEQLEGQLGQPGEMNLYLWRDGSVHFVTTLQPNRPITRMEVTPDGAHMALVTASNLTDYDSGGFKEMYTYAPGGRMICASCRPDGKAAASDVLASENGLFQARDGRVFFSTSDPLVPRDTNGLEDIYEFTEGKAQLISTGIGPGPGKHVLHLGSSPGLVSVSLNGADVYFATVDNLVTQDHNGAQLKIYDARSGGGYPAEREEAKCVAADECHGPNTNPSPLPPDRTSAPIGTPAKAKSKSKPKSKHKKAKKHKKARKHKTKRGKHHG